MGLRLWMAWRAVTYVLGAPGRRRDARIQAQRDHERDLAQIAADSQARLFEALARGNTEMVRELGLAMAESTKPMVMWLEGFKTSATPQAHTVTESTELGWDREEAQEVLDKARLEDRELFQDAWPSDDGRLPPPVGPDFSLFR